MRLFLLTCVLFICAPSLRSGYHTAAADSVHFICNELLGRPTTTSMTINLCADRALEAYAEYGIQKTLYTNQTPIVTSQDSLPFNIVVTNLQPNTTYFYRVRYRIPSGADFLARDEHVFKTAKTKGTSFTFAIEADPHLDTNSNSAVFGITLQNILEQNPDFLIDLGDTFMSEKLQKKTQDSITIRHLLLRSYFDLIGHSIPLYLVIGNHEGELGWLLDGTVNNLAVMASSTRTKYYSNPIPDNYYSGNSKSEKFVGLRQNFYSWEWGSALFVVLDPYWYTKSRPGWGWTLGADQYTWLKNVLTTSQAKFKFIFCHQLVGGNGNDGRGGTEYAHFFEMGGRNSDSTWGFDTNRPGWQKTIHTLMVENNVSIFFHGHDHFYGRQEKDGIVYQEVPQPSLKSYTSNSASQYGYVNGVIMPNRGYLLVTVTDTTAKVEYIRTYLPGEENAQRHNKDVSHSYTLLAAGPATYIAAANPLPAGYAVCQNYPNPFNPTTVISYQLPVSTHVTLRIYDVLGREVTVLVNGKMSPGTHTVSWNAAQYSSGLYFYCLAAENFRETKKMFLIK